MKSTRLERSNPAMPLGLVHVAWLAAFFFLPLAMMLKLSLDPPEGIANYTALLVEPYSGVLLSSLGYAGITTLACLVIALALALTIVASPVKWRNTLLLLCCLPFWINILIRLFALQQVLGRQGLVNSTLQWLWDGLGTVIPILPEYVPLELLYNNTGLTIGLVYSYLPLGLLPIYATLANVDRKLIEAGRDLGASAWHCLLRVRLPLAMPGLYVAALLIAVPVMGDFYIAEILGGPNNYLLGNMMDLNFKEANNWPLGAAMSMSMMLMTALLIGGMLLTGRQHMRLGALSPS